MFTTDGSRGTIVIKLENGDSDKIKAVQFILDCFKIAEDKLRLLFNAIQHHLKSLSEIESGDIIFDIGTDTIKNIGKIINLSKTLLWNGPLGFFEKDFFANGSNEVAKLIKINTQKKLLTSIAGGGDTAAAIKKAKAEDGFSYISTAGGAFLEWLEGKILPGLKVLEK